MGAPLPKSSYTVRQGTPRNNCIASGAAEVGYEPVWGQILLYYSLARDYPLAGNSNPSCRREQKLFTMEVAMKVSVTLLSLALAGAVFSAVPAGAQEAAAGEKKTQASTKETKWQGHVIRIDKDHSMIDIRGGAAPSNDPRKVAYDSSTEWTKLGKPSQQDEVKEGSFVILLGHLDHKGVLHATRIDLRRPR
jgi:hypothetical protein